MLWSCKVIFWLQRNNSLKQKRWISCALTVQLCPLYQTLGMEIFHQEHVPIPHWRGSRNNHEFTWTLCDILYKPLGFRQLACERWRWAFCCVEELPVWVTVALHNSLYDRQATAKCNVQRVIFIQLYLARHTSPPAIFWTSPNFTHDALFSEMVGELWFAPSAHHVLHPVKWLERNYDPTRKAKHGGSFGCLASKSVVKRGTGLF